MDVMARLAGARPALLDEGARPDPVTRARELAVAVRHDAPVPRKSWRPVRPRWALAALPVAAAVAVAVVQGGGGGSGVAPGGGGGNASDYLLAAASKVEAGGEGAGGAYWFQEEQLGTLHQVPGDDYVIDQRTTNRQWLAEESQDRWSEREDRGTGPASEEDEKAWRAAGAPGKWTLPAADGGGVVRQEPGGVVQRDAPNDGIDVVSIGGLATGRLDGLPTEPGALREELEKRSDDTFRPAEGGGKDELRDQIVVWQAIEIAVHQPADAELRAAAYRLLSQEPGVRDLGVVKDHSGRKGNGVALPSPEGNTELRLILDRSTGAPLGTLTVAVRAHDGWNEGETVSYTTTVEQRWTDTAPGFQKDSGAVGDGASESATREH
ncbi:CU044_5270 family protein [Streptomyces sp. NPDC048290]|uniref:CU044_5270 family protein n=1 Tax=Streptomyces sp. NPDC048290 TaxID=3155811 RepID=UPI00341AB77E